MLQKINPFLSCQIMDLHTSIDWEFFRSTIECFIEK